MSFKQFLKTSFFSQFLYIGAVVIFLFLTTTIVLHFYTRHGQKLSVPYLKAIPISQVIEVLQSRDLRYKIIDTVSYNEDYPKLSVLEQNPRAGSFVKKNRVIYLTLNAKGYKQVDVPEVVGKTKREAIEIIKSKGLKIGKILYATYFAKDVVMRLRHNKVLINKGEKIKEHSEVDLIVGDGTGKYRGGSL